MRNKKLFQKTNAGDHEFRVLADDELDFVSGGTDSHETEGTSEETQEVQCDSSDSASEEKKLADLASQAVAESASVETSADNTSAETQVEAPSESAYIVIQADNTSAETQVEAPSESAYIEIQADNTSAEDVIEISGENPNIEIVGDASEDRIVVEGSVSTTHVETPTEEAFTLNQLSKNQGTLEKSLEKLSSGMKIDSAADDPSGYQIAERMRVQVRSLDQANYNAQNGRSMMKVEEGAVDSTVETLRTLKEKVINAVNDTNTEVDRESIQKDINESIQQIDDNALLTFNGKFLNNGSRTVNGETTRNVLYTEQQNSDISNELSIMNSVLQERNGNNLDISATDMVEVSYVVKGITYKTEFPAEDLANAMKQVREEQGSVADNLSLEDMRSAALGLSGNGQTVSVSDKTNATATLKVIDNALQRALNQEASIGAVMNRLEFTSNNLTTSSENLQSAESTYRDADMAKEMTEFTKNNILMQAATQMLAQANQQNQSVLQMLQ